MINDLLKTKLPQNIKSLRKKEGLTQKQLAVKLGKKESTIRMWELGLNEPTLSSIIELSNMFNVSIDELVGLKKLIKVGLYFE